MSIIVMTTTAARKHENADALRVYTFEAPGFDPLQIVANISNVYEVGDVVVIAHVGTVLDDGTEISKMKVRGVLSFGMAMGKTTEAVGTDLTEGMGAKNLVKPDLSAEGVVEESAWPRYTSLPGFLSVRAEILAVPDVVITEKLHGSNLRFGFHGARQFMLGTHTSRVIESREDPATWPGGHLIRKMAQWVEDTNLRDRIARYRAAHPEVHSLAVFGELYGFKCSDLHYARQDADVRLFGEVVVNGRWLGYDDALDVISGWLFAERPLSDVLVPVLYRGKPSIEVLKKLRDQPSELARRAGQFQISEGIVIRPTVETFSEKTKDRLTAKFKSPIYEERKSLRNADPDVLPTYVTAYDLLADFITDERIRHVLGKAASAGKTIENRNIRLFGQMLYADIQKESVGEWPAGSELLDQQLLARWTFDLAGEMLAKAVAAWEA